MSDWIFIFGFIVVAIALPASFVFFSWILRPTVPERHKRSTYESGEIPTGDTRIRFNVQYYMVALLFLVFDIEIVLLFPWALVYTDAIETVGLAHALLPALAFIVILLLGLVWAWRNGAVDWARTRDLPIGRTRT